MALDLRPLCHSKKAVLFSPWTGCNIKERSVVRRTEGIREGGGDLKPSILSFRVWSLILQARDEFWVGTACAVSLNDLSFRMCASVRVHRTFSEVGRRVPKIRKGSPFFLFFQVVDFLALVMPSCKSGAMCL